MPSELYAFPPKDRFLSGANVWAVVPDYFYSLDACHEMEKHNLRITANDNVMQRDEKFVRWDNYVEQLSKKMGRDDMAHATAAQRAEAFGLTMGLWKEGE